MAGFIESQRFSNAAGMKFNTPTKNITNNGRCLNDELFSIIGHFQNNQKINTMASNIECPVDFVSINENKARLTAGLVFILTLIYLFTSLWIIPAFLLIDFFVRGFNFANYSLLGIISDKLASAFSIKQKPTDRAPKRFAAKTGFLFSAAVLVFFAFDLKNIALILAIVIATFALLESAFGFCAGCHVYSFYTKFLKKKSSIVTDCFFLIFIATANITTAQTGKTETSFIVENYYKIKWGFADEFIHLWKTNHYPLLKKPLRKATSLPLLQSNQSYTAAKIAAGILK